MRVALEIHRHVVLDGALDGVHVFPRANATAVADTKDMRVHRLRRIVPPHVEHHVGGLAPYAGQRLQRGAAVGYAADIALDEDAYPTAAPRCNRCPA